MKNTILILLILVIVKSAFSQNSSKVNNGVIEVDAETFDKLIQKNDGTFLDVRTKSEYDAEHIAGAGQLNFYALNFKKKLLMLPKNKPVYLYCNTGYRSQKAGEFLVKNGYTKVYNAEHGIMERNLKELPVVEGDKSQLDKANFMTVSDYSKLINSDTLVFIDFYAPWCGPCRKMMPMIDSLKTEYYGRIKIVKANSDVSKKLVKELKLIGVPYLTLYRNGKLLFEKYGYITRKELVKVFEKFLK
ncbi:MAG: thioredoxin domain-containing protein [Bacteroidales bacterium]|nr:thioredoxin domain-containing protein [Bacteroidales bacterium]